METMEDGGRSMERTDKKGPGRVKAFLIDPGTMKIMWMNEAASRDSGDEDAITKEGIAIDRAVPMAKVLGLVEVISQVAETGTSKDLRSSLISSRRGDMSTVASIYRLPDGKVLLLLEIGWQGKREQRREAVKEPRR
jgi:hypothetical protein